MISAQHVVSTVVSETVARKQKKCKTRPSWRALCRLLADAEWSQWNNCEIARRCRVARSLVDRLRPSLSSSKSEMRKRKVQRGGAVYEMNVKVSNAAAAVGPLGPPSSAAGSPSANAS
jgi:hypothetical protein